MNTQIRIIQQDKESRVMFTPDFLFKISCLPVIFDDFAVNYRTGERERERD
jgi:hypothetical protein